MSEQRARALAVNVGGIRHFAFQGEQIPTGFFKSRATGQVQVKSLGLAGDRQADLTVHGGPLKAVYFYPSEHYRHWENVLGGDALLPGSFGENITSEGLLEADICVGDTLRMGTALLQVIQPRSPCYKLALRFQVPDMVARFVRAARPGWYAAVLEEGEIASGDAIEIASKVAGEVSIADIWHYSLEAGATAEMRRRVERLDLLPAFWKDRILRLPPD